MKIGYWPKVFVFFICLQILLRPVYALQEIDPKIEVKNVVLDGEETTCLFITILNETEDVIYYGGYEVIGKQFKATTIKGDPVSFTDWFEKLSMNNEVRNIPVLPQTEKILMYPLKKLFKVSEGESYYVTFPGGRKLLVENVTVITEKEVIDYLKRNKSK